jgi:hypothetical protein
MNIPANRQLICAAINNTAEQTPFHTAINLQPTDNMSLLLSVLLPTDNPSPLLVGLLPTSN